MFEGRLSQRYWQQIMRIAAGHSSPADMIRNPQRLNLPGKAFEFAQVFKVKRVSAANGKRHSMHDNGIPLGNLIEHVPWAPLRIHEVFRNNLKPIHRWMVCKDVIEMDRSQADT